MEKAVRASRIDITGKGILMLLLSLTDTSTAEIPPKHAPTYTELEQITSASRSTLVEWMRALTDAGWVSKLIVEGESKTGYALFVGDPNARRAPRKRAVKDSPEALIPAPREAMDGDGAYRQAARVTEPVMPLGDTEHAARRYGSMPLGDTPDVPLLFMNSPTESSTTNPTFTPPLDGEATTKPKKRATKPKKAEPYREDVDRVCNYLAEWIVKNKCKRPTINDEWRAEARRMIDLDGRSLEDIRRVIRFSQTNPFWRGNVLSIPKLRAKFDQLRLRMEAEEERDQQGRLNGGMRASNPRILRNSHENQDRYDVKL
ncbi:hypothetical protein [Micromonospora carbonacea]|uniref:hypothetical protein n=1 Tax=Micromonospora carbonacea TaxID=47853 RepID=UPI00371F5DE7